MSPTSEEKNIAIGEWLVQQGTPPYWRNWHTDESASAMLLERMPEPHLWRNPDGSWYCEATRFGESASECIPNRKTAIRDAFYAYIQSGAKHE